MLDDINRTLWSAADKLRANIDDFILANPPFNISDRWHGSLEGDPRWVYGTPPQGNANYAWLQHMLYQLKPNGRAGVVLANGSMNPARTAKAKSAGRWSTPTWWKS